MQAYQVKVLPKETFLYGGSGISTGNDADGPVLIIKNDRFGEQVKLIVVRQVPTQPATTTDIGVLERDQAFTLNLKFVLRVGAKTLAPNVDSVLSCTIMQGQL